MRTPLPVCDLLPVCAHRNSIEGWVASANYPVSKITYATTAAAVTNANLSSYKMLYIPSNGA